MKTIKELSELTGVPYATLQFWKRTGGLIPVPVGRNGRAALYEDSTVARIRHILELQEKGASLENIAELLTVKDELNIAKGKAVEARQDLAVYQDFMRKWVDPGDCKASLCNLFCIDPALASTPRISPIEVDNDGAWVTLAALIDKGDHEVIFARIRATVSGEVNIVSQKTISREIVCMLPYVVYMHMQRGFLDIKELLFYLTEDDNLETCISKAKAVLTMIDMGKKFSQFIAEQN